MRVLYHHRTRGKGAEGVHIMGIVKALRDLGHSVKILSLPGSDPETNLSNEGSSDEAQGKKQEQGRDQKSLMQGLLELTKKLPEFVFELVEIAYSLLSFLRVALSLRSDKSEVLYERYSLFMFGGILAAKVMRVPVVLEVNDSAIVERVRPLTLVWLAQIIEKWCFKRCTGIVFISSAFQEKAFLHHGKIAPSIVCPNGADIDHFKPNQETRSRIRNEIGVHDKVVCGYVGAFVYWHGIDWFVKEISPVLKDYPQLALLLVGDGVVYESIQNIVVANGLESQVIMTGRVPHAQVRDYIGAMDYGILPDSNDYGSPMKLFEMMSMEVPSVAPSFGPIDEVLSDGTTGWLFQPKDKKAAVNKVLELANQRAHVEQVGIQARQFIAAERQWKHNAQGLIGLIE